MRSQFLSVGLAVALFSGVGPAAADTWTDYDDIGPTLLSYETAYPTLCQRHDAGLSHQGRVLWLIKISDNVAIEEDEPEFKYIATMHGDEIVGTKMCMNLIDYLLTNYGTDPQCTRIIDETELWIMPLMNPDGYDRSPRTRYNAQGYDLNRSFPEGSEGEPNDPTGRPTEVQRIMAWVPQHSFTCSANFHGGALVANYPFDDDNKGSTFSPTPDEDMFVYISEEYSRHNSPMWNSSSFYHGITNGAEWYTIDGGMQDWNYRYMGCNEVTMEIGVTKQPSASTIPTYWSQNRDSMLAYIETCLIGVRGIVTAGDTGAPLAATVAVVGRDHDIFTDPDVGDYHRMLMPGTYDLTFSAPGYDTLTIQDVVVSSGDATRLDVALSSPALVLSPNGGETLPLDTPVEITWDGSATAQFQVQYTDNYGDQATITDGFERTSLGGDYTLGGDGNWYITTSSYHSGARAARSGSIGHSAETWMDRAVGGGEVSFWYRVSSENDYDWFNFYVDGVRRIHVSGTGSWTRYTETLAAGPHTLRWEYTKDINTTGGSDCAWIDDLEVVEDNTTWADIVALTDPGAHSTLWTPALEGADYKVRVRAYYGDGAYGLWDESNGTFEVSVLTGENGDYDADLDVDLFDHAAFQNCFGQPATGACGSAFEIKVNGLIDSDDFSQIWDEITGP